jgi:hypothetical protein
MKRAALALLCAPYFFTPTHLKAAPPSSRVPVLLELFTSEGCPDGPEADRLIEKLDREQPFPGVDLIVLSEHVDYFNGLGWADPFSSPMFIDRQRDYAQLIGGNLIVPRTVLAATHTVPVDRTANETQVYTPEIIVDGTVGFAGSDEGDAQQAVRKALRNQKTSIGIKVEPLDKKVKISIHMDQHPDGTLYLALAHDAVRSRVLGGPNAGLVLSHVAVLYSMQQIGNLNENGAGYDRDITVKVQAASRIVAFVEKAPAAGVEDAVSLSARVLHKSVGHAGIGRVTAIGQARL